MQPGWKNSKPGSTELISKKGIKLILRGHLKSSHIADKRKNFHMALYPLPPYSNESVIDNGRSVWQMAMYIILVLPHSLLKQCRLSHVAGTLPWSLAGQRPLQNEQGDLLEPREEKQDFFLLFLHAQKRAAGVDLQCPANWSKFLSAPSTWPSKANRYLGWIVCSCMHAPAAFFAWTCSRSRNDLRRFIGDFLFNNCKRRSAIGRRSCFFFFFFLTVDRTTNRVLTPSLPYESSFVCPRCANFWDDP